MMSSYYTEEELAQLGLMHYGRKVKISRKASLYGVSKISIGENVRIDDFCVLSGNISIGNNVHINPFTGIYAGEVGVTLCDYANLSSRTTIYAVSDDYSGDFMTSPLLPKECTNIYKAKVVVGRFVIIGTGSVLLPGVEVAEGCAIGAMSLVKRSTLPWGIYAGIPCSRIKERNKGLLRFVQDE